MKLDHIKQGLPSWVELAATDEDAAVRFYSALFGWNDDAQPMPEGGAYHTATVGGDAVAGIASQSDSEAEQRFPAHWTVYLAVDDADAVTSKIEAAGGTLFAPPFEVMDLGRMAIITDPTGGVVGLWQARTHEGFRRAHEPNTVSWCELVTDDPDRAASFFSSVFDVHVNRVPMGPDEPPYILFGPEGEQGSGIMQKMPEMGPVPNAWAVYFEVADCDQTARRAEELGGAVIAQPQDIMPGRFAMLRDPQGAVFGIIHSAPRPS